MLLVTISQCPQPIRVSDVANVLDSPVGEMSLRLQRLRGWGYLKFAERKRKAYGGFVITEAGKRCVERLMQEQNGKE